MSTDLSSILQWGRDESGLSMSGLTVLSVQRDPYRLATDAHRRNADWLAEAIEKVGIVNPIHLRGLHYRLVGSVKLPDGSPYNNTDANWLFLSERAALAARFLGTVDFDLIRDNRNAAPQIFTPGVDDCYGFVSADIHLSIPDAEDLVPKAHLAGTFHRQAWRLCIIGEKSGLSDLITPLAERYQASLALPNGEISTTMTEEIIAAANQDGRPLAILYLADCDPAGWQMCISFARKAQAIIDIRYPNVRMRVHPIALTPDQSREWDLPSTPLKETEKRADRWQAAMGIAQTEIDAAIGRAPDELFSVVRTACLNYYDPDLATQGAALRDQWESDAQEALESQLGEGALENLHDELSASLSEVQYLMDEINEKANIDPAALGIELPPVPDLLIGTRTGGDIEPLIDTAEGFVDTTIRLKNRKGYL